MANIQIPAVSTAARGAKPAATANPADGAIAEGGNDFADMLLASLAGTIDTDAVPIGDPQDVIAPNIDPTVAVSGTTLARLTPEGLSALDLTTLETDPGTPSEPAAAAPPTLTPTPAGGALAVDRAGLAVATDRAAPTAARWASASAGQSIPNSPSPRTASAAGATNTGDSANEVRLDALLRTRQPANFKPTDRFAPDNVPATTTPLAFDNQLARSAQLIARVESEVAPAPVTSPSAPSTTPTAAYTSVANLAPAAHTAVFEIRTPVGALAWTESLTQTVMVSVRERVQEAEIRVQPQELGPISMTLKLDGDSASIAFNIAVPETRALVESNLPQLKEALASAGLSLTGSTVDGGSRQSSDDTARGTPERDTGPSSVTEITPTVVRISDRLVDTFA